MIDYKLLFYVACSICLFLLIMLLVFVRNFLSGKKKLTRVKEDIKKLDIAKDPMSVRVSSMESLLKIIDVMISTSIISRRKFEIFLNTKNKNLDYDTVIKDVSKEVMEGLRENVFLDNDLIFSQKYLMKYIIDKTTISYIAYIKENIGDQL